MPRSYLAIDFIRDVLLVSYLLFDIWGWGATSLYTLATAFKIILMRYWHNNFLEDLRTRRQIVVRKLCIASG